MSEKKKSLSIYFVSLGCPRNLVDTEVMIGILTQNGYLISTELKKADFIVVNTCGFLEESCQEAYDILTEIFDGKKKSAKVIATGCLVQRKPEEVRKRFPNIHYLLGSGDVDSILDAIQSKTSGQNVSNKKSFLEKENSIRFPTTKPYAYVKIAEGCRKRCSYCAIPQIKGPLKSKEIRTVVEECKALIEKGTQELILVAQDLADYGKDLPGSISLLSLVQEILKIPGHYWLRLMYVYPEEISDEMIQLFASDPRICRYIDMPIQHIHDKILKQMLRKTSKKEILNRIDSLRKKVPGIVIRTSLMVGFPGETEEQFQELVDFVTEYQLDQVGIFSYSKEKGTLAYDLENQVSEKVKKERHARLAKAQLVATADRQKSLIGKKLEAFVEGYHVDSPYLLRGRHQGQAPEIDGMIIINDGIEKVTSFNTKYQVQITDVSGYDLIGKVTRKIS